MQARLEETAHLGPGCYELPDLWVQNLKSVRGRLVPSSGFCSPQNKEVIRPTTTYYSRASSKFAPEHISVSISTAPKYSKPRSSKLGKNYR